VLIIERWPTFLTKVVPLGVVPLGVVPIGVVPLGVVPLGVVPLGVVPLGVVPIDLRVKQNKQNTPSAGDTVTYSTWTD
jgi:hypothetical protein